MWQIMTRLLSTAENISRSETIFRMRTSVEYETKLYFFIARKHAMRAECDTVLPIVSSIRHIMALYINECIYR